MKRCSTSYAIREMQGKTMRYCPISTAAHHGQCPEHWQHAGDDVEQQELLFIAGGIAKWYGIFERQVGGFL